MTRSFFTFIILESLYHLQSCSEIVNNLHHYLSTNVALNLIGHKTLKVIGKCLMLKKNYQTFSNDFLVGNRPQVKKDIKKMFSNV